ncbi:hypothetical protein MKZ38_010466 [Zalerion maritima]|uniref:Phosphoinositide phospholipase C n=1 Tax=Zalerion maritima TaxID=339359 RepID=A0AAD5WSY4_9PEZI|nr:hypothetical protein MKZ38_010466 [Zalerion maritima]
MTDITSRLSKLNPFSKSDEESDDDVGEEIDNSTVAGGGHAATHKNSTLRVSPALRAFMAHESLPSAEELLEKSHIRVPASVSDRSHPLPEYFVSSSHNTYLMAHQLFGSSNATAYETALNTGSRCVEIDAWDGDDDKDEPKVTHGYTLVSNIHFRVVCETIRDVMDQEAGRGVRAAPIMLSLENHCGGHGQMRLAQIMREVFGERLVDRAVEADGLNPAEYIPLEAIGSKVVVIVEYHYPDEPKDSSSSSSSSSSEDEEEKQGRHQYKQKKKEGPPPKIIAELAELGVYAQSVKPKDNSWFDPGELTDAPHHHLINVSETGLSSHLPANNLKISMHNSKHLMRVYPKGTRISSRNLNPVPFWGLGAQICALNWQTFSHSMQINDALFAGTDGYVLKPAALRAGGSGILNTGSKKTLRLKVAGATDIPIPKSRDGDEPMKPYLTCTLIHPDNLKGKPPKRKTSAYKEHKLGFLHRDDAKSPPTDPVWDQTLEWTYDDNELVLLRMLIKSDDGFSRNPKLAVSAVRIMYLVPGWSFIRMLDLHGHETACSLLVKFEIEDA